MRNQATQPSAPATEAKRTRKPKPTPEQIAQAKALLDTHEQSQASAREYQEKMEECWSESRVALEQVFALLGSAPLQRHGETVVIKKSRKGVLELVPFESGAIKL